GLVRAKFPNLSAIQAMEKLRMAATRLDTISPYTGYKYLFGRRLDMYSALTKEVKSIRMTSFKAASPSGTALLGGDTITLTINLKNYLSPTTVACKAKLKCDSTYIKLVTDEVSIGALSTLQAIESQQFRFIIDKAAPKLVSVKFLLEYFDHDHYDYQVFTIHNININYLDLDTNHITLSITDNGRLGYTNMDANIGSGLQYLGANNSLYEGGLLLSTDEGKLSDCVRNESTQNDDFVSMDHIRYQNSGLAHRHITSTYGDTSASGVHVEVQQNSFAWSDANHRNYVVVEYQLKNTSGEKINKLNAAVFSDWDIPSLGSNDAHAYSKNKVIWDSTNNLSIAYNTLTNGLYVGTRLLTNQKPIYAALDNKNVNGQFTDTEKLRLLSSGVSTLRAGTTTSLGTDISALIGVSISNLAPQETATFALTFIIGTDILNLQDQSRIALDRYRSIRTSAAPEPVSMTVCHDSPVLRSLGGGKKYNFYTSLPLNSNHKIKTDSLIDIPEVSRDTAFYVTNHDDVFESTPSLVKIVVSTYTAEGFTILPIGSGKYLFYTNQAYKNIAWVIDHDTVSKNNNYIHQFTSNGAHTVKLILTSPIDCVDAASKEVFVSEVLTLLVGEIIGDEIEVYPIPTTGDKLYVDIPETMLTHIQASITNLIGVDLGVKYALKPGKNPIDVSHLDHGIYFINIFAYNKVYKYKFIVA
ncbi:MAG TPA: T9SS type A sorting domain-containing protein, partial [Cytophagales bacterium]|nr:T9SS type A sorting domain-containing protein [Cytophagales bacterium]